MSEGSSGGRDKGTNEKIQKLIEEAEALKIKLEEERQKLNDLDCE